MQANIENAELLQNTEKEESKGPSKGLISIISITLGVVLFSIIIGICYYKAPMEQKPVQLLKVANEDLEYTEAEHQRLSRRVATEGMVLATNRGLPIQNTDKVVLFGPGTNKTIYGGTGSGEVYKKGSRDNIEAITVLQGMETKAKEAKFVYCENKKGFLLDEGLTEEDIKNFAQKDGSVKRSVAVLTLSRVSGEFGDRKQDDSNEGTLFTENELNTHSTLAKYFDVVVVVLNVGSVMELNGMEQDSKTSILIPHLPGMEAGNAIADVLVGDVNPSGHLTDTWAKTIDDYPTTTTFKESKEYVKYKETLFVGYRYFELDSPKQEKVVFPFGHGLSYTTFTTTGTCRFNKDSETFSCLVDVTNDGERAGKQVVQIYAQKPENRKFVKAPRELVAFGKTELLQPHQSQQLQFYIKLSDLASYDETGVVGCASCYILEKGEYKIFIGNNVADTRLESSMKCSYYNNQLKIVKQLSKKVPPEDPDVANANEMPDFKSFMNNHIPDKKRDKEHWPSQKISQNGAPDYFPTDNISAINMKSVLEGNYTLKQMIKDMSDEELAFLAVGHPAKIKHATGIIGGNYNAEVTQRHLIPSGDTTDGPAGLRQSEYFMQSTAWPSSTVLACTFDTNLVQKLGEAAGKEARRLGTTFFLAPGMNLHRSPLCGRNFEYYSEDPFLTGKVAAAITKGVQSKRVSITLKHLCANNKEENRNGGLFLLASDSRMAERVAREIYLKGFEIAVKEAKPWSIMTSYNRLNSIKTSSNHDLLIGIVRKEWGYDGLFMTDWATSSNILDEIKGGGNVKMPVGSSDEILEALKSGSLRRYVLEESSYYILNTLSKTHAVDPLFNQSAPVDITNGAHIKIIDKLFNKDFGIAVEPCEDTDKGYNPTNTVPGSWITIRIKNDYSKVRNCRIRYSGNDEGFGVWIMKYDTKLGEITNLPETGGWQNWKTSGDVQIDFPKGTYELTLGFLAGSSTEGVLSRGNINWIEIDS